MSRARYDYDDIRREQEREDEIYRRRLLQEQQAAAEQVCLTVGKVGLTKADYEKCLGPRKIKNEVK